MGRTGMHAAEIMYGPEGARKLQAEAQLTGKANAGKAAAARAKLMVASTMDPENAAFIAAGGAIASAGKLGALAVTGGTAALGGLYGLTFFNHEDYAKPKGIRPPAKPTATTPDIVTIAWLVLP